MQSLGLQWAVPLWDAWAFYCTPKTPSSVSWDHPHNTPLVACGRKAVVGHVLVPSCLLGNTLQVTASAVPHLPAPTICGIKALIWSQCLKANSSEARDWGSTAFSCPGTGNSRCWGKGNVGNLCGDAPLWEPGYKAAKCCEVQASLRSQVLWKDLWIPSFILRYWCSPLWTYMVYSAAIV